MNIVISQKSSRDRLKIWHYLEWGKNAGERKATGIFTYTKPKDQLQKNHNKEALAILQTKQSQMVLERQAVGSGYTPTHLLKANFLDFYAEYVERNKKNGSRHLEGSLTHFKAFLDRSYVSAIEITENLCQRFRKYLLDKFNGETPADYFYRFKTVLKAATKQGYFRHSPAEELAAKAKANKKKKEILEPSEYMALLNTPSLNHEVKRAFIFCLYTGLRWADVKKLNWNDVHKDTIGIEQEKTHVFVEVPLHPKAQEILGGRKSGLVFKLPTADGANKALGKWCDDAKIGKHITWHCARHSFSVLLQDQAVSTATVAGMLGHTSTKYVERVYQRYRVHMGKQAIERLPT